VSWLKQQVKRRIPEVIQDPIKEWRHTRSRSRHCHGSLPNIWHPKSFNEKVTWRLLFDRRPILSQLSDKAAMRKFVANRLGDQFLPKMLFLTNQPNTIPFNSFPTTFVVKATHGSGWVHIVRDKARLAQDELIQTCNSWLSQNYYLISHERIYKKIYPQILVEEFIGDDTAIETPDYKIFVFHGVVQIIQVDVNRSKRHRQNFYTRNWAKLDVRYTAAPIDDEIPAPSRLDEMMSIAETLGRELDFVRVDLYHTQRGLFVGEMTMTPNAAKIPFDPPDFDRYLGDLWRLPSLAEVLFLRARPINDQ
jgi:hypothetical protein